MPRVRVSGRPLLPPETAEVGGELALAEFPDPRCQLRATSPPAPVPKRAALLGRG
jgi:hypothetical protein